MSRPTAWRDDDGDGDALLAARHPAAASAHHQAQPSATSSAHFASPLSAATAYAAEPAAYVYPPGQPQHAQAPAYSARPHDGWAYGGAGAHHAQPSHSRAVSPSPSGATTPARAERRTRPPMSRKDSEGWARLLRGAGYDGAAGDDDERGADDEHDSRHSSSLRRLLRAIHARSIVFMCLGGALLFVPALVALFAYDARPANDFARPEVWNVGIFWWSIWLCGGVWLSWFAARVLSAFVPALAARTLGGIASLKAPIAYLSAVQKYAAIFLWTVAVWVVWIFAISRHYRGPSAAAVNQASSTDPLTTTTNGTSTATTVAGVSSTGNLILTGGRLWFGFVLCAALLLFEKLAVQWVAFSFHRVSYESRIAQSKLHVRFLIALYSASRSDLVGKGDKLAAEAGQDAASGHARRDSKGNLLAAPLRLAKRTAAGVKRAGRTSTSVLGSAAAEMTTLGGSTGSNSFLPKAIVLSALGSASETRKLSRRIFYSFSKRGPDGTRVMRLDDLRPCFPDTRTARAAMEMFDEDGNGSVTEEECEMSCANVRRERNGLTASMSDIDSAVAKLDSIFVSCYLIVCLVIVSALLSTKFATLAASFGSILLGLSWLIGATASEALSSIIFVFGNHVLDVGDHCQIEGLLANASGSDSTFIVHEIQLLSTVFKTTAGKYVQVSNAQLRQKVVVNLRRSGPIAEDFQIDVGYGTSMAQIERLRGDMLEWIQSQKRDFLPGLDVQVVTLADQSKLKLQFDIRYKSNWQTQSIKNRRRNRWILTLKELLHQNAIFGPGGDPSAINISRYALVDAPAPPEPASSHRHEPPAAERELMDDPGFRAFDHSGYGEMESGRQTPAAMISQPGSPALTLSALPNRMQQGGIAPSQLSPAPQSPRHRGRPGLDDVEMGPRR